MSLSLPALAFVLALQSIDVAASVVYLLELANNGNVNGSSSTTASTSTSTTSSNAKHQSSTTHTSDTHTSSSSTSITQSSSTSSSSTSSSSTSTTTTTGTLTSSSSSYTSTSSTSSSSSAPNNVYGSTSTTSQGLSAAARTGLAFGIMIFLILSAMLVCYLRRRSRIAREKTSDGPALLSSEISQYHPPAPGVSPERELLGPPPPRLNPAYPNMPDISRSSRHPAISSIAPLLSDVSSRSPHPVSAWNRYSTSSSATNTQPITTEDVPTLPNPHDSSIAPTHSASHVCSTPHIDPFNISVLAPSAATMSTFIVPAGGSSNSQEPPLSSLYTDLVQHQKQLELEHDKGLKAQEGLQDPPPEYSS